MEDRAQVFRSEAIKHQGLGTQEGGAVLRLSPAWLNAAFWLLLGVVVFYVAFGLLGQVPEYASGPAVVHVDEHQARVFAVLPGGARPLLAPGATLRLELQGFPSQYQELTLEELGDTLVEPREVRQELGAGLTESLGGSTPVVRVQAHLPSRFFSAEGQRLAYFEGMQGTISVRVRSERLATALIPGLKHFFP